MSYVLPRSATATSLLRSTRLGYGLLFSCYGYGHRQSPFLLLATVIRIRLSCFGYGLSQSPRVNSLVRDDGLSL
jgi:hypothetical protein